jgi:hypothetical protein
MLSDYTPRPVGTTTSITILQFLEIQNCNESEDLPVSFNRYLEYMPTKTPNSTGGTGYIGGSVLHTIVTAHPEYDVTVLLRNVPDQFDAAYPNVKTVKGDYDNFDILAKSASEADVVVRKFSGCSKVSCFPLQ